MFLRLFQNVLTNTQSGHDVQAYRGFVKKHDLGIVNERPHKGNSLLVTSGQSIEFPVEIALKAEHFRKFVDSLVRLFRGYAVKLGEEPKVSTRTDEVVARSLGSTCHVDHGPNLLRLLFDIKTHYTCFSSGRKDKCCLNDSPEMFFQRFSFSLHNRLEEPVRRLSMLSKNISRCFGGHSSSGKGVDSKSPVLAHKFRSLLCPR